MNTKIKNVTNKAKDKARFIYATLASSILMANTAFAEGIFGKSDIAGSLKTNTGTDGITNIINILLGLIFGYIIIQGLIKLVMGLKAFFAAREDGDSPEMDAATRRIVTGALMMAIPGIATLIVTNM